MEDRPPAGAGAMDAATLSQAVARLQLLHALDRGILDGREVGGLLQKTLAGLAALVGADRVSLTELDRAAGVMKVVAESRIGGFRSPVVPLHRIVTDAWLDAPVAESFPDLDEARDRIAAVDALIANGTRSLARFPVLHDGRLWVLAMTTSARREWSATEMEILQEVASQVIIAVRQAAMLAALAEREARVRRILRQAANAMIVVADDLRVEEANPMAIALFQQAPERLVGAPLDGLVELDSGAVGEVVRSVQSDLSDRGPGRSRSGTAIGREDRVRVDVHISRLASGLRGAVLVELARRDGVGSDRV